MPHGIRSMSRTIPGLVSTSTNLAAVRCEADEAFILTSQRSDIQSMMEYTAQEVRACLEANGASYRFVREYPAWTPQPDSALLQRLVASYQKIRPGQPVTIGAIHAGLECGVIGSKQAGMDMVSFGPDIRMAHTPQERVNIVSTGKIWDFLLAVLGEQ
jgi:dipeptidase D